MLACYCISLLLLSLVFFIFIGRSSSAESDFVLELKPFVESTAAEKQLALDFRALVNRHDLLDMRLVNLKNTSVTCNDGSPAGFYVKKGRGNGAGRWIIFLEGGWFCFDPRSCHSRFKNMRRYMSSTDWPTRRASRGILSYNKRINPVFHEANVVFVPYCSSDAWSGQRNANNSGDYAFHGSLIIRETILQLLADHGMSRGGQVLLTGSSAGGTGVVLNLDKVSSLIRERYPSIDVRGLADSGWFLDNEPYKTSSLCTVAYNCAPQESIEKAASYWNGQVPASCADRFKSEPWRCYFAYRLHPLLRTPLYVVNFLFDEAQIAADNVGPPLIYEQWRYIHSLGKLMERTLQNISAVFAPACLSHVALNKIKWYALKIDGVSLAESLKCWLEDDSITKAAYWSPVIDPNFKLVDDSGERSALEKLLLSQSAADSARNRRRYRTAALLPSEADHQRTASSSYSSVTTRKPKRRRRRRNRRKRKDSNRKFKRRTRSLLQTMVSVASSSSSDSAPKKCRYRLVDKCFWPQCNPTCPKYFNPFTRRELNFVTLLTSQFGLKQSTLAKFLGIDVVTLQTLTPQQIGVRLRKRESISMARVRKP